MKLHLSPLIASALLAFSSARSNGAAFVPAPDTAPKTWSTRLFISSWGSKGPPSRRRDDAPVDPSESVQSYLPSPVPATARANLDGAVLVSGFANSGDRTDQRVFDLLNDREMSPFRFTKIVAFVDDVRRSKKRLMSRTARYSGLLDRLVFVESESDEAGGLPTLEQLRGVKSWVASVGNDLSLIRRIGELSVLADVRNVSILVTDAGGLDIYESVGAVKTLRDRAFTVVAVGEVDDEEGEGSYPYAISEFGTKAGKIPEGAKFSRDEGVRIVAECLGLECASGRALSFERVDDVNATESRLIRGMREAGYVWSQELEHMVNDGAGRYEAACEEYRNSAKTAKTEAQDWMEREEEKLRTAQEAELRAKEKALEDMMREREETMAAERERAERGMAEWA